MYFRRRKSPGLWSLLAFHAPKSHLVLADPMGSGRMVFLWSPGEAEKPPTWDVTVICPLADSHVVAAAREAGSAAEDLQRGPGTEPRYGVWGTKFPRSCRLFAVERLFRCALERPRHLWHLGGMTPLAPLKSASGRPPYIFPKNNQSTNHSIAHTNI